MIRLSELAKSVQPSATLAAGAKARALKNQGIKVYDFSLGEPDFNTPRHICEAAEKAMASGQTHYTPAGGTAELKKAIAEWYKRTYGLECGPEHVLVSNGAKHSIHNALVATVGVGDEVVLQTPCWVSYVDLIQMAGAKPVPIDTGLASRFKMTPQQLEAAITPKTRMVMLNSPSNPTGAVYTREELLALVEVILRHPDVIIMSDEIYELLCYGTATPTCVATLKPGLMARTITISGASKSYAMTGWRMGWAVGPVEVIKAMDNIQSQETSCPSSVSQAAMVVALNSPETPKTVETMRAEFAKRRELVYSLLSGIPGVKFDHAEGAFYAFFDVSSYFGKSFDGKEVKDSMSFCNLALEQAHVNLVAGAAFGSEGFARMSFATDAKTIEEGLTKLKAWLATAA
jgi:aspartate aminotransferase